MRFLQHVNTGIVIAIVSINSACKTTATDVDSALTDTATQSYSPEESFKKSEAALFDGTVNQLDILMHGDTWNKMVTHKDNGGYSCDDDAPYGHIKELKYTNSRTGEVVKMNNVGIRVKGNTSCDEPAELKGFKLKFNATDKVIRDDNEREVWRIRNIYEEWGKSVTYPDSLVDTVKKQSLFGNKTLSLRRGGNDVTRVRDALSSDVFEYGGEVARRNRSAGAPERGGPVYRAGLIWVRIHNGFGTLMEGHYGVAELVDDDLIKSHYSKESVSHLFKIKDGKGTFLDSDMPSNRDRLLSWYEPEIVDGDDYTSDKEFKIRLQLCKEGKIKQGRCDSVEKERKKAEEILRGFRSALTKAVEPSDRNERRARLSELLDIDNILSYAAAANLTGHWDSLIGAISNNDYLFHNKKNNRWGIITWDLDNTFGTASQNYPWMASISDFGVNLKYRPIFGAVLNNFAEEYKDRVKDFINNGYGFERMGDKITQLRDAISPGSTEEKYEILYKFKNHRWGNAWCNTTNNNMGSKVKIKDGWPDVYKADGKYKANCQ